MKIVIRKNMEIEISEKADVVYDDVNRPIHIILQGLDVALTVTQAKLVGRVLATQIAVAESNKRESLV